MPEAPAPVVLSGVWRLIASAAPCDASIRFDLRFSLARRIAASSRQQRQIEPHAHYALQSHQPQTMWNELIEIGTIVRRELGTSHNGCRRDQRASMIIKLWRC